MWSTDPISLYRELRPTILTSIEGECTFDTERSLIINEQKQIKGRCVSKLSG